MSRSIEIGGVKPDAAATLEAKRGGLAEIGQLAVAFALAALFIAGLALRLSGINAIGFSEDEINKLEAVHAYRQGDISPNAEHPMLMKALIYASVQAANSWNDANAERQISDEAAVRLPNILFGALTIFPLFLLTAAFFDRWAALLAAALWAFGINAITYNRIAKEDTLLVFFMLFAFYFYVHAKQAAADEHKTKRRSYILSGASFGLMFASKYFPHYLGLNALYHHYFRVRERGTGEAAGRTPRIFYWVVPIVFLLANPVVLLPQTWAYLQSYTSGQLLTHTGYLMGEHLYKNNMSSTPFWGTPLYFYLLFLAIKLPLPTLFAFIVGLVQCVRRPRHPGHAFLLLMFLFWIVPFSLIGGKWLRYTLSLMPFVYMIAAIGIIWLIRWSASLLKGVTPRRALTLTSAALTLLLVGLPALTAYSSSPHYAAYTNALGGGRTGYYFPHDEFYDDGLREAIGYVCARAPQGATITHETPGVMRYYLAKCGRADLQPRVLSDKSLDLASAPEGTYFILQRGRTYFENQEKLKEIRARYEKIFEVNIRGASAVEIYAARAD